MDIAAVFDEAMSGMDTVNVADMLKNVDTSQYEYLDGLTPDKLRSQIYNSLQPEIVDEIWPKLTQYRYVYSLNQLRRGRFVRWIGNSQYKLSYGGMVVDIEITDNCPMILCKTPIGKMVKFDFNANRVYQKLNADEKMLILLQGSSSS
jgi:hypothetical protein